eukprot:NODE_875_length_571_cov_212.164414_g865_i0.p1 GENE.NODE_875_length_571_cov_212.164414_g865_i0~~NODE_875_length_571_cov_212.164414_g865_i0.p1  ORF type:complete len:82 (+),score=7.79 NODE_875_length_571_cov_212.164414_g865_i0:72-317(+)
MSLYAMSLYDSSYPVSYANSLVNARYADALRYNALGTRSLRTPTYPGPSFAYPYAPGYSLAAPGFGYPGYSETTVVRRASL